jgi:hypothetical protein
METVAAGGSIYMYVSKRDNMDVTDRKGLLLRSSATSYRFLYPRHP